MKLRIDGRKCVCVLERERGKEKKNQSTLPFI